MIPVPGTHSARESAAAVPNTSEQQAIEADTSDSESCTVEDQPKTEQSQPFNPILRKKMQ